MAYFYSFLLILISLFFPLQADETCLCPLVDFLVDVANAHKKDPSQPIPIVAIGGCPGVGKTYLTKQLLSKLKEKGIGCATLPIDDFNLSSEERKKMPTEWGLNHFKYEALHGVLADISSNTRLIKKPTYDQVKGTVGEEVLDLRDCNLVLFEGLYSLCSHAPLDFFSYCAHGIFLEAAEKDVVEWKWKRELKKISPRSPERFQKHIKAMLEEFHRNISYSKKNAVFVIKKDSEHNYLMESCKKEDALSNESKLAPKAANS